MLPSRRSYGEGKRPGIHSASPLGLPNTPARVTFEMKTPSAENIGWRGISGRKA